MLSLILSILTHKNKGYHRFIECFVDKIFILSWQVSKFGHEESERGINCATYLRRPLHEQLLFSNWYKISTKIRHRSYSCLSESTIAIYSLQYVFIYLGVSWLIKVFYVSLFIYVSALICRRIDSPTNFGIFLSIAFCIFLMENECKINLSENTQAKKYCGFTIVFLEEIRTVKLWASTQCIFPTQNLSITYVTIVKLKYTELIL